MKNFKALVVREDNSNVSVQIENELTINQLNMEKW